MKINKKFCQFLLIGLLLIVFSSNVNADTYSFSVSSTFGDRDIFNFTVNNVGTIFAEATWTGSASNLALILNGPGQEGYYMREDGTSPLSLSYTVTSADLSEGKDWRISIINFEDGNADGTVMITYPMSQMTPLPTPAPHTPTPTPTPTLAPHTLTPTPTPTLAPHTPTLTPTPTLAPHTPTPTPTLAPHTPTPTPQEETEQPVPFPHTPQEEIPGFLTLFSLIAIFLVYYKNRGV
jgi:hypothetical protein